MENPAIWANRVIDRLIIEQKRASAATTTASMLFSKSSRMVGKVSELQIKNIPALKQER